MDQEIKKTPLCVAPFLSLAIWSNGASVICCHDQDPPVGRLGSVDDISELVNSERMCNARKQFMKGEIPAGCSACIEESKHQSSMYHFYEGYFDRADIADYYNEEDGTVSQTKYLLLALSNLCTYSCRMCAGELSTRLDTDLHNMLGVPQKGYLQNDFDKIIRFIRSNPIHTISFHGGNAVNEPRFVEVLSALPSSATVQILTNGSTFTSRGKDIRPHLERFKEVLISISLDGTRMATEYVRVHSDFDAVFRHFEEAKELPNAIIDIHNTVTNLNLFDLPAFYSMVLWGKFADSHSVSSTVATDPAIYRVSNLPDELRQRAKDELEEFLRVLERADRSGPMLPKKIDVASGTVRNVIRRLDAEPFDPDLFRNLLNRTKKADEFYGFKPLPHLSDYYAGKKKNRPEAIPANAAKS